MAKSDMTEAQLVTVAPMFLVADIQRSVRYYRDVLGFAVERIWGDPPSFAMPIRDGLTVMLLEVADKSRIRPNGTDGESWDAHFWVRDADQLFRELAARNVTIAYAPLDRDYYGNREFAIYDPDRYLIAFGHDIEAKRQREATRMKSSA